METDGGGDSTAAKRCVSLSHLQRPCSPLPGFSYLLNFLAVFRTLCQTKMSVFDVFYLCGSFTSGQNSTCKLNSPWIWVYEARFNLLCTEMSFRETLSLLWVHFWACIFLLYIEYKGCISTVFHNSLTIWTSAWVKNMYSYHLSSIQRCAVYLCGGQVSQCLQMAVLIKNRLHKADTFALTRPYEDNNKCMNQTIEGLY